MKVTLRINPDTLAKSTLILLVAVTISSPTLWLIETSAKFFMYIFEVCLIFLVSIIWFRLCTIQFMLKENSVNSLLDYLFVVSSLSLLFLNTYSLPTISSILVAIAASAFLPGYVFLRLVNFHCSRSYLETILLSFALSIPFTATIVFLLSPIENNVFQLSVFFVILSFLPIAKTRIKRTANNDAHILTFRLTDVILISLLLAFFAFVVLQLYPKMAWLGGWDIARLYSSALLSSKSPSALSTSLYPFFTAFQASVLTLSSSSMVVAKTSLACMSIVVVLSFFVMAKIFLEDLDSRFPPIATVIWFLFSGLGWIFFAVDKLLTPNTLQINRLYALVDKSYADIGYGLSPNLWLWFLPMTVSFTILFMLLYLLKRPNISRRSFVAIFSLGAVSLFFIHPSELVVLVVFLFVLAFIHPNLRLREAQISVTIGLVGAAILMLSLQISAAGVPYYLFGAMFTLSVLSYSITSIGHYKNWRSLFATKTLPIVIAISTFLLVVFLAGFFSWGFSTTPFTMGDVIESQFIPWLLYPVRIGIAGALALIGIIMVAKTPRYKPILVFACLLFLTLIMGRTVSILNQYFVTGYWEWRFLFFVFAAAAMLAPIAFSRIDGKSVLRWTRKRVLFSSILLATIVFAGFSSTFLTIEFQTIQTTSQNVEAETQVLPFFLDLIDKNADLSLLTTPQSGSISSLLPVSYAYSNLLPMIWSSRYPEVPMSILYGEKYPNSYIYLTKEDGQSITSSNNQAYLTQYLLQRLPTLLNSTNAQVLKLIEGVPPVSNSETVLVVPSSLESGQNIFLPYDVLSLSGYNYTTMLDSDPAIYKAQTVIFATDPFSTATSKIIDCLENNDGAKVMVFNTNGYGTLSSYFFKGNTQIDLKTNSTSRDLYIHSSTDYTNAQTTLSEAPIDRDFEFIIDNDLEENNVTVLSDDTQTEFWHSLVKSASSSIALSDQSKQLRKGSDSLQQIWKLSAYDWGKIEHSWASNQDWSNNDFLCFYFKGDNTGRRIEAGIYAPDSFNMQRWVFTDNFTDWRRFVLPLNKSSQGWQIGNPDLTQVRQIEFFVPLSEERAIDSAWYLDRVLLDTGRPIDFQISFTDQKSLKGISCYNGTGYEAVPYEINAQKEIPRNQFFYLDGQNGELFGEVDGPIATVTSTAGTSNLQMLFSLRLPPDDGADSYGSGISQTKFKIEFFSEEFNAQEISGKLGQSQLPTEIKVIPVLSKTGIDELSVYSTAQTKSPFAARALVGKGELIYVNIYPLVKAVNSSDILRSSLYSVLGNLLPLSSINLPKYDSKVTPWIMNDSVPFLIFANATLSGVVNTRSSSIVFPSEVTLEKIDPHTGTHELFLQKVTSLAGEAETSINVLASKVEINWGRGFYASLIVADPEIRIVDGNSLIIGLDNGSTIEFSPESSTTLSIDGAVNCFARTPLVQNEGNSIFERAYSLHSYYSDFRTLGEDLHFKGSIEFIASLSDAYSFATDVAYNGSVERQPPILRWDELKSLENSAPWLIFFASLFAVLLLTRRYPNVKIDVTRKTTEGKRKNKT